MHLHSDLGESCPGIPGSRSNSSISKSYDRNKLATPGGTSAAAAARSELARRGALEGHRDALPSADAESREPKFAPRPAANLERDAEPCVVAPCVSH